MTQKIALLGGTFDPVHVGHVQLAEAALVELALDKVLFIPAPAPPHKRGAPVTSFSHRVEMLRLALCSCLHMELCLVEETLPRPSYTIDTIRHLQSGPGKEIEYHFIIGLDAFLDILCWKDYRELLSRVGLLVAGRSGVSDVKMIERIAATMNYRQDGDVWYGQNGMKDIHFLKSTPQAISSSVIRDELRRGITCAEKIHPDVVGYIQQHQLYRRETSGNGITIRKL